MMLPFATNSTPAHSAVTVAVSLTHFFGESLKHAPDYHVIDGAVLFGEEQRLLARDEQGMVVCHLAAVQAAACRHGFRLQLVLPFGQAADEGKQLGDFPRTRLREYSGFRFSDR